MQTTRSRKWLIQYNSLYYSRSRDAW